MILSGSGEIFSDTNSKFQTQIFIFQWKEANVSIGHTTYVVLPQPAQPKVHIHTVFFAKKPVVNGSIAYEINLRVLDSCDQLETLCANFNLLM